jgi:hypothetical protein
MTKITSYADITPLEPEWEIPGLVPKSIVTLIIGDGGVGKGQLWGDWAGRITRGARLPGMPDTEDPEPAGSVLLVSSEDDPNMSTAWRLRAANAVLDRVYDFTEDFSIPESLPGLAERIDDIGDIRLVVIDPLADNLGFVPGTRRQVSLTSGNVTLRRYVVRPLERLARDKGIALVVIHHTVKSGRMAGSKGISDAARMVLRITRPDDTQPLRLITVEKTNIASGTDQVGYLIGGDWPDVRVTYVDPPKDDLAVVPELSAPDKVLGALQVAPGPLQKSALPAMVGENYTTVGVALTRLKGAGLVVSPKRGWWTTPDKLATTQGAELELVR